MSTKNLLPPVTIEHVYGFVGDKHEPHLVNHLNTGICAEDAEAYKVKALPYPASAARTYGISSTLSIVGAAMSISASVVMYLMTGIEAAILGLVLAVVGLGLIITAVTLGMRTARQRRRYDASQEAFKQAVTTILRTQGRLIPLPIAGWNGHGSLADEMIKDLEEGRANLLATTGDRHALITGGEKLFVALHHLGIYAQADYEDQPKYEAARDSVHAFIGYVTHVARQPKPAGSRP